MNNPLNTLIKQRKKLTEAIDRYTKLMQINQDSANVYIQDSKIIRRLKPQHGDTAALKENEAELERLSDQYVVYDFERLSLIKQRDALDLDIAALQAELEVQQKNIMAWWFMLFILHKILDTKKDNSEELSFQINKFN